MPWKIRNYYPRDSIVSLRFCFWSLVPQTLVTNNRLMDLLLFVITGTTSTCSDRRSVLALESHQHTYVVTVLEFDVCLEWRHVARNDERVPNSHQMKPHNRVVCTRSVWCVCEGRGDFCLRRQQRRRFSFRRDVPGTTGCNQLEYNNTNVSGHLKMVVFVDLTG